MSIEQKVHQAQVDILHVLLFRPHAGFAELQKASGLSSDHFNFHIKQLLERDFVVKNAEGKYTLTFKGKEFSNRFDTDAREVERQPKVAVCLIIHDDQGRTLMQQRLKQPYFGWWGRPTGKIRWGETILQAAARELMEETGLEADLEFRGVYHKMDYNQETNKLLEDKIFFNINGTNPRGELTVEFEGGRNQWMTDDEIKAQEHCFVKIGDARQMNNPGKLEFVEVRHDYSPTDY